MRVDMRAISFESSDGVFEGKARAGFRHRAPLRIDHQALRRARRSHRGAIAEEGDAESDLLCVLHWG